jgi:hypothetical protein
MKRRNTEVGNELEVIRLRRSIYPPKGRYRRVDGSEATYPLPHEVGYRRAEPFDELLQMPNGQPRPIVGTRWVIHQRGGSGKPWLGILDGRVRIQSKTMMSIYFHLVMERRDLLEEGRATIAQAGAQ